MRSYFAVCLLYFLFHPANADDSDTALYNIWTHRQDAEINNKIFEALQEVGLEDSEIEVIGVVLDRDLRDVDCFQAKMTKKQLDDLEKDELDDHTVYHVTKALSPDPLYIFSSQNVADEDDPVEFTPVQKGRVVFREKRDDLVYISQPKMDEAGGGVPLHLLKGRYAFDNSSGRGVPVYMVDTGANLSHSEFEDLESRSPRVRWGGPFYQRNMEDIVNHNLEYPEPVEGDNNDSHGTAQLDKMIGVTGGVVMHSTIIMVRMGEDADSIQILRLLDWIYDDWSKVKDEAGKNNLMGVINLPIGFPRPSLFDDDELSTLIRIGNRMNDLVAAGLLPVCSSGNLSGEGESYFGLFRTPIGEIPQVPKLVVVGATDEQGKIWTNSETGTMVDLTAPGKGVLLAIGGTNQLSRRSGTSTACTTVAGLAAYFAAEAESQNVPGWSTASSEQRLDYVRYLLISRAYPRRLNRPDYPKGVWNGMVKVGDVCGYQNQKRDAASPNESQPPLPPLSSSPSPSSTKNIGRRIPTKAINSSESSSFSSSFTSASTKQSSAPSPPPSTRNIVGGVHSKTVFSWQSLIVSLNETGFVRQVGQVLTSMCPPWSPTSNKCTTNSTFISDLYTDFPTGLTTDIGNAASGKLRVYIDMSSYTSDDRRRTLLSLALLTLAKSSSKCHQLEKSQGNCAREVVPGSCEREEITVCSFATRVYVMIYDDTGSSPAWDYLSLNIEFDQSDGENICEKLQEIIELDDILISFIPELRPLFIPLRRELVQAEIACMEFRQVATIVENNKPDDS